MSTIEERPAHAEDEDERRLKELGYTQELHRAWSSFSNFAISFTIISVLAGTFTTYGQAWNNGGPVAISWGWPLISIAILIIAWSMSELVSKYPTAGGIYYWATALGGPAWGWFTGWFNLIGLVAVVASVDYACATFLNATLGLYSVNILGMNFGDSTHILSETFVLFAVILFLHALLNIFSTHLLAMLNNVSVWVHVVGVVVIIALLVFVPDHHQSVDFVFTERFNNSGFGGGMYWFYVLPLGFLLTQYTITGFDASAHISEETRGAAIGAARGVWQSVFYSAIIGWFVLLAITFAATDVGAINDGAGSSLAVFGSALSPAAEKAVVLISTIGQFFCGMACVTSASRMTFAFSRDNGLPRSRTLRRVNEDGVPRNAVIFVCIAALIVTLPALEGDENAFPYAFFAVVSITVIGLYIAYVIPIFLRWRMGDAFEPGPWTLGKKYKWMNAFSVFWVGLVSIIFCLPFTPAGVPWRDEFDWKYVNYAPITVIVVIVAVWIWWVAGAKHKFRMPDTAVDGPEHVDPEFVAGKQP
ncbi:MAG TPA: amino acid permease [Thermoleophilaceae bacterium]|nr:amino acid permease [Thermoleophilaceae bacterium]